MSGTDHLTRAKEYIAKGEDYYRKAVDEIQAARTEDPDLTWAAIDRQLGRGHDYSRRLVAAATSGAPARFEAPFGGEEENQRKDMSQARTALKDPEQRRQVIASLPSEQIEELIGEANEVAVDRARAERAEHATEPTVRDLTGDDPFDPAEYWADTLVIRVNRNARELAGLINRAGGLLFGTMPPEEAFDYLHEAERLIAEARAAAQEQVRDRTEV